MVRRGEISLYDGACSGRFQDENAWNMTADRWQVEDSWLLQGALLAKAAM